MSASMKVKSIARLQLREPGLFEIDVIVRTEIVDPDHFIATIEQSARSIKAYKTGGASHQKFHEEAILAF